MLKIETRMSMKITYRSFYCRLWSDNNAL